MTLVGQGARLTIDDAQGSRRTSLLTDGRVRFWIGALVVLGVAAGLFSRFAITEGLRRDEAVFAYGGQQLAEGIPPYVSILDAKTPLATFISGAAVAVGRPLDLNDLDAIRLAFFVIACLTVVGIYVVGTLLFESQLAGIASAVTFATFKGFAIDALGGPNAKTPGILFAVVATALLIRRQWFWAGVAASLALLVWQPLAIYAVLAVVAALVMSGRSERWRNAGLAIAGIAIPGLATLLYFAAVGAFGELVEGAILLPTVGRLPASGDLPERVTHIIRVAAASYGLGGAIIWAGLGLLVLLISMRAWHLRADRQPLRKDPLILLVAAPLAVFVVISLLDFQGYPDLYPLLPYAALGIGGGAATALALVLGSGARDQVRFGAAAIAITLVIAATWAWYSGPRPEETALRRQQADATAAASLLQPGETVRVLGTPAPLVLMNRRNPSSDIYLSAGIDQWVMKNTPGGFEGWTNAFLTDAPDMVIIGGWNGEFAGPTRRFLSEHYLPLQVGDLKLFVTPAILERSHGSG
ncbi:MAG TPA: DolP-mannose mannosyltransferase [Candidatus Limnocylindria bacterium]